MLLFVINQFYKPVEANKFNICMNKNKTFKHNFSMILGVKFLKLLIKFLFQSFKCKLFFQEFLVPNFCSFVSEFSVPFVIVTPFTRLLLRNYNLTRAWEPA